VEGVTITLEPDELVGLHALVQIGPREKGNLAQADVAGAARTLLRDGLATKLNELGLPWAPTPEFVEARSARTAQSSNALRRLARNERATRDAAAVLVAAALVALGGGYIGRWRWTGFPANNQVWDWLNLLLLPVVIGTVPIWLLHAERMSRSRRRAYGIFVVAFVGFVTAGYVTPLNWTGFRGNTLWNWLLLIVLPVTIVVSGVWSKSGRALRTHHKAGLALLGLGWIVSLVGGYAWTWRWTGYSGNTLWDWLQLLLLPLVFPTILLPATLKWVSGNAAEAVRANRRASEGTLRSS
jgi:hypothetical protein